MIEDKPSIRTRYLVRRREGGEQPHWRVGPFKIRLPLVHYPFELAEVIQGLIMSVVGLAMIPLLQEYLLLSFEASLAVAVIFVAALLLPAILGVPIAGGWMTPAIPLVIVYLAQYEPGPEAAKALVALHLSVAVIFLLLGLTGLAGKLVRNIPDSLKAGILIGAGIAALAGEIEPGGQLLLTPISITVGVAVVVFTLFSRSASYLNGKSRLFSRIANYGLVPGMLLAMALGWAFKEYPLPDISWGFSSLAFDELWAILPFSIGFPTFDYFLTALPIAIISYVISYGDIVTAEIINDEASTYRSDEKLESDPNRTHVVTGMRNLIHGLFAPMPGQGGPVFTAIVASLAVRYKMGRRAMESLYSGLGSFYFVSFAALFFAPIVTFFQPILPITLSLTLLLAGYICLYVGMQQVSTAEQYAVAGVTGVVLAIQGAAWGLLVGVAVYLLVEREYFGIRRNNGRSSRSQLSEAKEPPEK